MQTEAPSSSLRVGAIISLLGVALIIVGVIFFPMFVISGGIGNLTNAYYPRSEWFMVNDLFRDSSTLLPVLAVLFALPMVSMLFVLVTSIAAFFRELAPGVIRWRRIAALAGLVIQFLLAAFTLILYSISLHVDFGIGFGLALLGFLVMSIGTFLS